MSKKVYKDHKVYKKVYEHLYILIKLKYILIILIF